MNTMQTCKCHFNLFSNFLSAEIASLFLSQPDEILRNELARFHPDTEVIVFCILAQVLPTQQHNKSMKHFIRADGYISSRSSALCIVEVRGGGAGQAKNSNAGVVTTKQPDPLLPSSRQHVKGSVRHDNPHNRGIEWQRADYKWIQRFSISLCVCVSWGLSCASDLSSAISRSMQIIFSLFPCTVQQVWSAYSKLQNHKDSHRQQKSSICTLKDSFKRLMCYKTSQHMIISTKHMFNHSNTSHPIQQAYNKRF